MVSVLIQAGHENRTTGATGATGPNGWTERAWTPIVANSAANWLEANGVDTIREDASFNQTYSVDYAVFLHFDGSSNTRQDNASVGYSTGGRGGTNDAQFAQFWKDYYADQGWDFGFHSDNFTTNLSQYYGYSYAINTTAEILIEFGTMSNVAAAEWMFPRLTDLGTWVAEAIYIDHFGSLPGNTSPDLIAGNVRITDDTLSSGDRATVVYDITNIGDGEAGNSVAGVYLSTNSWISTQDTLLATQTSTTSDDPGDVDREWQSVTLPDNLAPGTYYIGVIADHNSQLNESTESNNRSAGLEITVDSARPDLTAGNVRITNDILQPGSSATVVYDISNIGDAGASDTTSGVYLSTNSWISNQDTLLATQVSTTSGGSGSVDREWQSVTLPGNLAPGTYYVGVLADYNDRQNEANENNNRSAGVEITVPALVGAAGLQRGGAGLETMNGATSGSVMLGGGVRSTGGFGADLLSNWGYSPSGHIHSGANGAVSSMDFINQLFLDDLTTSGADNGDFSL